MLVDFPDSGDEPVTLGDLKDRWRESRQFEEQKTEFEDWHDKAQNEVIAARRTAEMMFERMTHVMPPEVVAKIYSEVGLEQQHSLEQGRRQLMEYFPEWRDAQKLTADREELVGMLGSYGFSKQEVGSVLDPRMVKFAMDAMRLRTRYERLKSGGSKDIKASLEPPSRKVHRPSVDDRAKALAAGGDKNAAVALLLRDGRK